MTVTLTPEMEEIMNEQMATGQFESAEQVLWAALMSMRERYAELKAAIAEGEEDIRNGRLAPFDPRATLEKVRAERAKRIGREAQDAD